MSTDADKSKPLLGAEYETILSKGTSPTDAVNEALRLSTEQATLAQPILALDQRFFCSSAKATGAERKEAVMALVGAFAGDLPEEGEDDPSM